MKYEITICNGCNKKKPIINKTHVLCLKCNRDRLNKQSLNAPDAHRKPVRTLSPKKGTRSPERKRLPNMSIKQSLQYLKYNEVKAQKKADMIAGKYYNCFFSGQKLDPDFNYEFHHALGKVGDLMTSYRNIFPCIRKYHTEYHSLSADKLMKTSWYPDFVKRIKKMNHRVYNKELDRLLKAKVISMETFLQEFK